MPLAVIQKDITKLKVDAIVNAANAALAPGGGVCGAIFAAAGYGDLDKACRKLGGCPTGQAVITDGFALPAKYIVHTVGGEAAAQLLSEFPPPGLGHRLPVHGLSAHLRRHLWLSPQTGPGHCPGGDGSLSHRAPHGPDLGSAGPCHRHPVPPAAAGVKGETV